MPSRAAGIAVVLGAGAALSLGLAGAAAADPRDSANASGPTPAQRAVSHHATRADAGPRPRPTVVRRNRNGTTAPAPVGSASRGDLLTIYKGTHFVVPNRWALWIRQDSGAATFTPNSTYDLTDDDQYDWNKLAGITFTPLAPNRNSAMVVWRYNLTTQMFEVGPFFNNDFAYVFPTDAEVIDVPVNETFGFSVDYTGITVTYGDRTVSKGYPAGLVPIFWTSARVTGWFGGSEVAPRTVSYYLKLN